jgi:hypothetical protein
MKENMIITFSIYSESIVTAATNMSRVLIKYYQEGQTEVGSGKLVSATFFSTNHERARGGAVG